MAWLRRNSGENVNSVEETVEFTVSPYPYSILRAVSFAECRGEKRETSTPPALFSLQLLTLTF